MGGGQKTYEQCWYASYQMLYTYHTQPVPSIDGKLAGKQINVADALAHGLADTKYHDAGTALGMTMWSGEKFKQKASWIDMGLTDGCEAFINELIKGPLWVSRFVEQGSYHATVAIGFKWGASEKGYIIYNNPMPGPANAIQKEEIPANEYVKHITSARGSVQSFRT